MGVQNNPAQVTDPTGPPTGTSEQNTEQAPPQTPPATPPAPPPLHEHPDFKGRMEQAQRAGQRALLAALGLEGLETPEAIEQAQQRLAADLQFAKEQREANMTAEQKLTAQITSLTSERDRLAQERDQYKQVAEQAQQTLADLQADTVRASALEAAAAAAGVARPADAVMWARAFRSADYGALLGEENAVDDEKVKALIAACAEARPEWFAARTPGSPSHAGAKAPAAPSTDQQKRELARNVVRRGMR